MVGRDGRLRVWRDDDAPVLDRAYGADYSLALSPDGRMAASGRGEEIRISDAATGDEIRTFRSDQSPVYALAISSDGKRLAGAAQLVFVRNIDGGDAVQLLEVAERALDLAFIPEGEDLVVSYEDGRLMRWNARTGEVIWRVAMHDRDLARMSSFTSVAVSPNGSKAVTGGTDGLIRVWDAAIGQELSRGFGHTDEVSDLSFTPDGDRLVSTGLDGTIRVWDVSAGFEGISP
jgi:WD40 repeat protein